MNRILPFALIIMIPLLAIGQKDSKAVRFLMKSQKKISQVENLEYSYNLTTKSSFLADSGFFSGNLKMMKKPSDKYFGFDYYLKIDTNLTYYYSSGNNYTVVDPLKTIFLKKYLKSDVSNNTFRPESNRQAEIIFPDFFIQAGSFKNLIEKRDIKLEYKSGGLCNDTVVIIARFFNQELISNYDTALYKSETYYLSKKTKMPYKISREVRSLNWTSFDELKFFSLNINSDSVNIFFKTYTLPPLYKFFQPEHTITHSPTVEVTDLVAPKFELMDYKGNIITSNDLSGKLVVLDFWYTTCAPCIKASVYLDSYSKLYADSGVVILGMNPVDQLERVEKFFSEHPSSYNSLMCTKDLQQAFDVSTFPTFVVISPDWKIIYKKSGFSINIMNEINLLLQQETRKMRD